MIARALTVRRFVVATIFAFGAALCLASPRAVYSDDYEPTPACDGYDEVSTEEVERALDAIAPSPRLFLTDAAIENAKKNIAEDPRWKGYYEALVRNAETKMEMKPVERVLTGVRLLSVSREALKRCFDWSFLYRMTGDEKYAKRLEQEALAIADFEDWHPRHFLDVAEMTLAESIAYDVCKETFSDEARAKMRKAIYEKGILPTRSMKLWWKRNTANWNQVCWCGALAGALAIATDCDETERPAILDAIHDAVNGVTWAMSSYEPDGNYTEGPGYWAYGTSFNIMLLDALQTSFGTDFGRSDSQGFLRSIEYYEHVFGTTGDAFNYPDSGGGAMFEATAFWYERKTGDRDLLWNEHRAFEAALALQNGEKARRARPFDAFVRDRLACGALLWGTSQGAEPLAIEEPSALGYVGIGNGKSRVALFRTAWDMDGAYLGIKCGTPKGPHGHMDEGGFVYDDKNVRWICELGPENYTKIESRGMSLWTMEQNSDRWKLLRYNNFGHSVPTIDGQLQLVDENADFIETKIGAKGEASSATIDLTPLYKNVLAKATRKATLEPDGALVVEDSFEALPDKDASVERRFVTGAEVSVQDGYALMKERKGDLTKRVSTQSDVDVSWRVEPCETENDYDSKNPGVSILIESSRLEPGAKAVYTTRFEPAVAP